VIPGQRLPPRTRSLSIDYTALSLSIPERVRFRYRLDGVDEDWQDVGTRRQAFYTNLDPGRYRFRVIASNDDGVWNETGAALKFSIEPAFFETAWFRAVCVLLALVALYALHCWRLQLAKARLRDKLQERLAERERIARELHDTLLQSVSGLILRFDADARRLPPNEPVRQSLQKSLERADEVLLEGRSRVLDLRSSGKPDTALVESLGEAGRALAQHQAARFSLVQEGSPRPLDPLVQEEVSLIAREALLNAFRHAEASVVELRIDHGGKALQLRIQDDGRGIEPQYLNGPGRPGHWGLTGMRERAEKIRAELDILCKDGGGTQVRLRIPAAVAYRDSEPKGASLLRRWRAGLAMSKHARAP